MTSSSPRRVASRFAGIAALAILALGVGGCLTSHELLVDRGWKLVEVAGATPSDPDGRSGVTFEADGRFTLDTGCNTGDGTYRLEGNRILLETRDMTARACDGATGAQEAGVLAVLGAGPTWSIDTGTGRLRLTAESGARLVFETP